MTLFQWAPFAALAALVALNLAPRESVFEVRIEGWSESYSGVSIENIEEWENDMTSLFAKRENEFREIFAPVKKVRAEEFGDHELRMKVRIGKAVHYMDADGTVKNGGTYYQLTKDQVDKLVIQLYGKIPQVPNEEAVKEMRSKASKQDS